jgi:predicted O-methyltransferase YrrM
MNVTLEELRKLSDGLGAIPDGRPDWLRAMPYSRETPTHYHRLLWELVRRYRPTYTIEIGIDKGGSTLALADGHHAGEVASIDISGDACWNASMIARQQGLGNLTVIHRDSLSFQALSILGERPGLADLVFIDGAHDFKHVYAEYVEYRKLTCQGGVILFDDIYEGPEMEAAWRLVLDPKIELPAAHKTGFGACKVDRAIKVPTLEEVLPGLRF